MRITPIPRAISPQDIVRIYVPAAPPDEAIAATANTSNNDRSPTKESKMNRSRSSSQTSIRVLNGGSTKNSPSHAITTIVGIPLGERNRESNRNSIIFGSGDITPVRQRFNDEELIQSFGEPSMTSLGQRSTSSSRRGSLSRKSPSTMFDSGLMECSHIAKRRLSSASNSENRYRMGIGSTENMSTGGGTIRPTVSTISIKSNEGETNERKKIMTSFEQLASRQRRESSDALNRNCDSNDGIDKYSPDDDENYSYSYYSIEKTPNSLSGIEVGSSAGNGSGTGGEKAKTKYVSESNIQYKALQSSVDSMLDYKANKRRPTSTANETTPAFHYDSFNVPEASKVAPLQSLVKSPGLGRVTSASTTTTTITKEYTRFYGTSVDEDEDDEEPKKSSDESSSSPNSKSILNTPVNETIPLLLASPMTTEPRARNDSYGEAMMQSPTRVPMAVTSPTSRLPTISQNQQQYKALTSTSSTHVPVSLHYKSPVRSPITATTPTSSSVSPATPPTPNHARPSRIPLLHSTQKNLSPTSPQSLHNDLNTVLPPVEIINQSAQRIQKLVSPTGGGHYRVEPRFDYDNVKRASKTQQNNGGAGSVAGGTNTNDMNTIRIKVNQNQRN